MFEPQDRRLLFESLRPPAGYTLDRAVGTTFSLDLLALLAVPLAFTMFDRQDDGDGRIADPLALLEAVRRHADRMTVFCQAGQTYVPRRSEALYGYLEGSVVEVLPPNPTGLFHPKVWILRFSAPAGPILYRLLVMSRNLTFDRSWDAMLVLDGELVGRKNAFAKNHPLGDFVAALPSMAVHPLPTPVRSDIDRIQDELRRVRFELPEGFEDLSFWPLGLTSGNRWPLGGRIDRLLVISPFVTEGSLKRLTAAGSEHVLVSRLESLDALDQQCLAPFASVRVLHDGANPEPAGEIEATNEQASDTAEAQLDNDSTLSGLHAKVYVADAGWKARVWTGSANATDAAFNTNVEFLVELTGSKSRCGIDAALGDQRDGLSFADLLQEYEPSEERASIDPEQQRLEIVMEEARRQLARAGLRAKVTPGEEAELYYLNLHLPKGGTIDLPAAIQAHCWPITLHEKARAMPLGGTAGTRLSQGEVARFGPLSFEALTSFFAFALNASLGTNEASARFVLNLPLEGAPEDRSQRILRSVLRNREQVLRYLLLLLLADGGLDPRETLIATRLIGGDGAGHATSTAGLPLLEALIRALHRNPGQLDQIARLVDDLERTPEGRELLPDGFDTVWRPIWAARRELGR